MKDIASRVTILAEHAFDAMCSCSDTEFLLSQVVPRDDRPIEEVAADMPPDWLPYCMSMLEDNLRGLSAALWNLASSHDDDEAKERLRLATPEVAQFGSEIPQPSYYDCAVYQACGVGNAFYKLKPIHDFSGSLLTHFTLRERHRLLELVRNNKHWTAHEESREALLKSDGIRRSVLTMTRGVTGDIGSYDIAKLQIVKECQRATGKLPCFADTDTSESPMPSNARFNETTRKAIDLLKQGAKREQVALRLGLTPNNVSKIKGRYLADS